MRELIRDNAMLLSAISRFNIAFGFGDSPVGQVCHDNGVDTDTFLCVCNLLSGYRYNVYSISLKSLMGYLRRAHTSFLDVTFPKIRHYLIDAINYSESNEAALLLMKFYDDYVIEVRRHMDYENDVVNKGIADELCISVHTVATHRRNISAKLEIHTAAGLTIFAIIHHLVDVNEVTPV